MVQYHGSQKLTITQLYPRVLAWNARTTWSQHPTGSRYDAVIDLDIVKETGKQFLRGVFDATLGPCAMRHCIIIYMLIS